MGRHLLQLVLFDASEAEVAEAVTAWMRSKGFERRPTAPLTWPHAKHERAISVTPGRGCVAVGTSAPEEYPRLQFELKKVSRRWLDLWLADSDAWGYTLHRDGRAVAGFHSAPGTFGVEDRPEAPVDVEAVAEALGDASLADEVRATHTKHGWVFADAGADAFLVLLGLDRLVGASSLGAFGPQLLGPGAAPPLYFRRHSYQPRPGFLPSQHRYHHSEHAVSRSQAATAASGTGVGLLTRVLSVFILGGMVLARPVRSGTMLLRWWRGQPMLTAEELAAATDGQACELLDIIEREGTLLRNPLHGCSIDIGERGEVDASHLKTGSAGTSVFLFRLGPTTVSLVALSESQVPQHLAQHDLDATLDNTLLERDDGQPLLVSVSRWQDGRWLVQALTNGVEASYGLSAGVFEANELGLADTVLEDLTAMARSLRFEGPRR